MKIRNLIFSIITLITFFTVMENARAENSVRYEAQSIQSGEIIDLNLDVKSDEILNNSYIELAFHNKVIDIKSVQLENSALGRLDHSVSFANDSGYLKIFLFSETQRSLRLVLKVEGLYSAEQKTSLDVRAFKINDIDLYFVQTNPIINVTGGNVRQGIIYDLGANYANPFNWFTKFPFSIQQKGDLDIRVYDYHGREVFNSQKIANQIRVFVLQKGGGESLVEQCDGCYPYKLEAGRYRLEFDPDELIFACGTYYLTIKVNNVFMCQPFTFVR